MALKTYAEVEQIQTIEGILQVFLCAEQYWGDWQKLEDAIAAVDYNVMEREERDWFIEFLCNACMRVWKSHPQEVLNRVEENKEGFIIHNYDWNSFKFGKQHGVDRDLITKNMFIIDKNNLSEPEIKELRRKCK